MEIREIKYVGRYMDSSAEIWNLAGKLYMLEAYGDGRHEATRMVDEFTVDRDAKSFTVEQILKGVGEPAGMDGDVPLWDEYELVGFAGDFPCVDEVARTQDNN